MKLDKLSKTTKKSKKRVGRGYGSGKGGHTSGRGQKGQKSRGKMGLLFEGTKMRKSLIRRLPFLKGKERFKSYQIKPIVINVKYLELFNPHDEVSLKTLIDKGIVDKTTQNSQIKILGDGELRKALTIVNLKCSKGAIKKIEKAGGKVVTTVTTAKPVTLVKSIKTVKKVKVVKKDKKRETLKKQKKTEKTEKIQRPLKSQKLSVARKAKKAK